MRNSLIPWVILGAVVISMAPPRAERPELHAFPVAKDGMERFVIVLPHQTLNEEDALQVELIVSQERLAEGGNQTRLANAIEARVVAGWGYTYYEVTGYEVTERAGAQGAGTPPAGSRRIPYNSRLPVVVYTPAGYDVRYRLWQAAGAIKQAEKE